jgi:predicted O-methyltransferase YrrM
MKSDLLTSLPIVPEEYDIACYEKVDYSKCNSLMHPIERRFINGLLRYYQPQNILELGLSRGGGTINLLNAIEDMPGANLTSIDKRDYYSYTDKSKFIPIAIDAKEFFPCYPASKWRLVTGKDTSEVMESFGEKFDFVVIDTAHNHPIESFNFLCILPYLRDGAVVVMHDISASVFNNGYCVAPRTLMCSVVAEKLLPRLEYDFLRHFSRDGSSNILVRNIVAMQIIPDTRKYISNVFQALMLPWETYPADDIENVRTLLSKHYTPEQMDDFGKAMEINSAWHVSGKRTFDIARPRNTWTKWDGRPVIFYGAGSKMREILHCLRAIDVPFNFPIWDQYAEKIGDIDGHKVTKPDLETRVPYGHAAVITIADRAAARPVRERLESIGYIVFNGTEDFAAV